MTQTFLRKYSWPRKAQEFTKSWDFIPSFHRGLAVFFAALFQGLERRSLLTVQCNSLRLGVFARVFHVWASVAKKFSRKDAKAQRDLKHAETADSRVWKRFRNPKIGHKRTLFAIRLLLALLCLNLACLAEERDVTFIVTSPPAEMGLSDFYQKYVDADGYPVVGSENVNDYAMKEAAFLITLMLKERPDVKQAMVKSGSRMIVMAHNEYTTDVPEHAHLERADYWDRRARGLGGSKTDPVCSCGEENLLAYPNDPYAKECILIHEFAHNIHLRGLVNVDDTFDDRVKLAYEKAMADGLWKEKYASTNHHEYFAEGVQSWFSNNRENDHDHNHVNTREELIEYDPGLAKLCEEVFGKTKLVYTKAPTRLTGHLEGYDPTTAPEFQWRPGTENSTSK